MKKMTAAQYRKAQEQEFEQMQAIERVEEKERERKKAPQVLDSANPAPYVKFSVPVRGIFQDSYGVNEVRIPFKHGGAGRGQGRKAADGATDVQRKNVTLDAESIETLRALGDGDLSLGIRRAAAHIKSSR